MLEVSLAKIGVLAGRIGRFADLVEADGSEHHRRVWAAAMEDLRGAIRDARHAGATPGQIRDAAALRLTASGMGLVDRVAERDDHLVVEEVDPDVVRIPVARSSI